MGRVVRVVAACVLVGLGISVLVGVARGGSTNTVIRTPKQVVAITPDPQPPDILSATAAVSEATYAQWEAEVAAAVLIEEERIREVEREAARRAASSGTSTRYHPGETVGECTGFVIPAYIIQRESGGNPSAYNPSGAYGCAQTLLSHYSRGQCQGLDPYTIDGQRECVYRLSNGGTNLNPWAATR